LLPDPDEEEEEANDLAAAFAAFGLVPEGEIETTDDFFLWPENLDVFRFWLTVQSQWSRSEQGHRLGLNYAGVQVCLSHWLRKKKEQQQYFWLVQTMESAVIAADAER